MTPPVALLIEQTREREGALPLLQFALAQIWDGLAQGVDPADTLTRIGGVGGALARKAQELYDSLPAADQVIVRRAFLGLVHLGEGARDTRRRIRIPEIVAQADEPTHVHAVLRLFSQPGARLITLSSDAGATEEHEQAALPARQAYFLNQDYDAGADDRIAAALRMALLMPDEEAGDLAELVCQLTTRDLTLKEWQQMSIVTTSPTLPAPI